MKQNSKFQTLQKLKVKTLKCFVDIAILPNQIVLKFSKSSFCGPYLLANAIGQILKLITMKASDHK